MGKYMAENLVADLYHLNAWIRRQDWSFTLVKDRDKKLGVSSCPFIDFKDRCHSLRLSIDCQRHCCITSYQGDRSFWCVEQLGSNENFDDVLWTDESKLEICRFATRTYRKDGSLPPARPRPKNPFGVRCFPASISLQPVSLPNHQIEK